METENQILTTQQSLDIITKMIRQAHGNVKKSSVYLILWGLSCYPCEPGHVCFNVDGVSDAVFSLAHYRASMDSYNLH